MDYYKLRFWDEATDMPDALAVYDPAEYLVAQAVVAAGECQSRAALGGGLGATRAHQGAPRHPTLGQPLGGKRALQQRGR